MKITIKLPAGTDAPDVLDALEDVIDRIVALRQAGHEPSPGVRFPIDWPTCSDGWWKVEA